ncbi:MAG: ABC transporter ATP-binding protein [Erysipelotrichaceae bacterium]|nr:ABC transporter ATP-binding protein [Erysipelotrichaceae bacterium]MCI9524767.1 ABC transporter ATP-binding protein [Erysipelotrichaceae bacterium]
MHLLDLKNVNITYHTNDKKVRAVRNVSLSVDEQESVGIVGESGSGKSTLVMGILRLLPENIVETSGEALLEGKDIFKMSQQELHDCRWTTMSVIFQKSMNSLSPVHRIGKQMEDIYRVHYPNESSENIKKRIYELLKIVNLSDRVYMSYPHELSGGMMQRVAIALSLIFQPKLLIMDEATTALDVVTQSQILNEIMELEKKMKISRIMITHDVSVVASTCKRVVVMYAGELMEQGDVKDVLLHPKHPYTQGLLRSFPSFKGARENLKGIEGNLPDLSLPLEGCVFADRCPHATKHCLKEKPKEIETGNRWSVRCHLLEGGA